MSPHARKLLAFIRERGGEDVRYVDNGRGVHARIKFRFKGEDHIRIISRGSGPGDYHGERNEYAALRAILGDERRKSDRPKRTRVAAPVAMPSLPKITAPVKGFEQLRAHKFAAALSQTQLNKAWLFFWRACMNRVGGESRL